MWWNFQLLEVFQRIHSHINDAFKKLKSQYQKLAPIHYFYPLILLSSQKICCTAFEFAFWWKNSTIWARSPSLLHQHCSLVADTHREGSAHNSASTIQWAKGIYKAPTNKNGCPRFWQTKQTKSNSRSLSWSYWIWNIQLFIPMSLS